MLRSEVSHLQSCKKKEKEKKKEKKKKVPLPFNRVII